MKPRAGRTPFHGQQRIQSWTRVNANSVIDDTAMTTPPVLRQGAVQRSDGAHAHARSKCASSLLLRAAHRLTLRSYSLRLHPEQTSSGCYHLCHDASEENTGWRSCKRQPPPSGVACRPVTGFQKSASYAVYPERISAQASGRPDNHAALPVRLLRWAPGEKPCFRILHDGCA